MAKWVYIDPNGGHHFHQEGCHMIDEGYLKVPYSILTGRVYIHPHHYSEVMGDMYNPCPACSGKKRHQQGDR